jgi:hypothetical protein
MTASKSEAELRAEKALGVKLSAVKSYQQAEDEYFERLWMNAEEQARLAQKPQDDPVTRPRHYMLFEDKGIEVRDVIERLVERVKMDTSSNVPLWEVAPMFESDYVQMMQYGMRFMDKNGVEDLKKARWYLDKMIEAYDSNS